MEDDESEEETIKDAWECEGEWAHGDDGTTAAGRRCPHMLGTKVSPARPSKLSGRRDTEGTFVASGEEFIIAANWKNHKEAHRRLEGEWTATTTFEVYPSYFASAGSAGIRSPGTDDAVGPAEDQDNHEIGERAEPKPDH